MNVSVNGGVFWNVRFGPSVYVCHPKHACVLTPHQYLHGFNRTNPSRSEQHHLSRHSTCGPDFSQNQTHNTSLRMSRMTDVRNWKIGGKESAFAGVLTCVQQARILSVFSSNTRSESKPTLSAHGKVKDSCEGTTCVCSGGYESGSDPVVETTRRFEHFAPLCT